MLPNCHLRSGSGQGLPRFLGGCPSIGCDRIAWVVKRKPAMLLQHFVIIYLSFFFPLLPSSSFDFCCLCVCHHDFQMVDWYKATSFIFCRLKAVWSRGWTLPLYHVKFCCQSAAS